MARSSERLGTPVAVSRFPPARSPCWSAIRTGYAARPAAPIRLTFSRPLAAVFSSARPKLSPPTRATGIRRTATRSSSSLGFRCRLRHRSARPAPASGGGDWIRRPGPGHDPPTRMDGAARLTLTSGAVARPAGYPTLDWRSSGLPWRRPACRTATAVQARRSLQLALPEHPEELPKRSDHATRPNRSPERRHDVEDGHRLEVDGFAARRSGTRCSPTRSPGTPVQQLQLRLRPPQPFPSR